MKNISVLHQYFYRRWFNILVRNFLITPRSIKNLFCPDNSSLNITEILLRDIGEVSILRTVAERQFNFLKIRRRVFEWCICLDTVVRRYRNRIKVRRRATKGIRAVCNRCKINSSPASSASNGSMWRQSDPDRAAFSSLQQKHPLISARFACR